MILDIPDGVGRKILQNWLTLADVTKLDSAFCVQQYRPVFQLLAFGESTIYDYSLPERISNQMKRDDHYSCYLEWLLKRGVLVSSLYLRNAMDLTTPLFAECLQKFGAKITTISVVNCDANEYNVDSTLQLLATHCPAIRKLEFLNCSCEDPSLIRRLFIRCNKIISLRIVSRGLQWFSQAVYREMAQCCPPLESLTLMRTRINNAALLAMLERSPNLEHFSFDDSWEMKASTIRRLSLCSTLKTLSLRKVHAGDSVLTAIVSNNPLLTAISLDFDEYPRIHDTSIQAIALHCPLLREFAMEGCPGITDTAMVELTQKCPQLERIRIYSCKKLTDVTLFSISKHCADLRTLEIAGSRKITDWGLRALYYGCNQLESVTIYAEECTFVSEVSFDLYVDKLIDDAIDYGSLDESNGGEEVGEGSDQESGDEEDM